MSLEEQQAVYEKVQAAYEAYNALTDEQKAEITGAEIFDSLFDVFNGMVNTLRTALLPKTVSQSHTRTAAAPPIPRVTVFRLQQAATTPFPAYGTAV